MPARPLRLLVVGLAALLLAGCVPFTPLTAPADQGRQLGQIRAIQGGECFRTSEVLGEVMLDFDREVACDRPHEIEVLRSVVLPEPWSGMPVDDVYELTDVGGDVYEHVMPLCTESLLEWTGLDTRIGGLPGLDGDVGLWPAVSGSVYMYLTPGNVWGDHPAVFCTYEHVDLAGEPLSLASATDEPVVASFGQADALTDVRLCLSYSQAVDVTDCAEPHHAEVLFEFDALRTFGDAWVSEVDPVEPSDAVWADLDEMCALAADVVFGTDRTDDDVIVQANLLGGKWYEGESEGINDYPVSCVAVVSDVSAMLDGPVWDLGDAPAPLAVGKA